MLDPTEREARLQAYRHFFLQCTIPIIGTRPDHTHYILGTGNLYRVAGRHFLVTAGHVGSDFRSAKPLFPADYSGHDLRPLNCTCNFVRRAEDPNLPDVAVAELEPSILRHLQNRRFLDLGNVYQGQLSRPYACLLGYPDAEHDISDEGWVHEARVLVTEQYKGPTHALRRSGGSVQASFAHSILLQYAPNFPKALGGMSGCAAWVFDDTPDTARRVWIPERDMRVLGIQVAVFPRYRVIEVACWGAIGQLLVQVCPEARGEVERIMLRPAIPDDAR